MEFLETLNERQLCSDDFFNNLRVEKDVGAGAFGIVSLAIDRDGNHYIIKKMDIDKLMEQGYKMTRLRDEIINHFAISTQKCPYVCNIVCVRREEQMINIVQEFCGRELHDIIVEGKYSEKEAFKWAEQLLLGLKCIHSLDIVHFDIKPGNLLIDNEDNLRIIDFGLAQHSSVFLLGEDFGGTPGFIPPEAVRNKTFDFRNDSYAAGKTIELLWRGLKKPMPSHIANLVTKLTRDYNNIPDMIHALNILDLNKYPLPKSKRLAYDIVKFDAAVDEAIQNDIEMGMFDPETDDLEEEKNMNRRMIYAGLLEKGMELSPEISEKYPEVLEE